MSAPDPVRQLVLEWISYARGDMSAARTLADNRADNVPATPAFHAHQAVEKAINGTWDRYRAGRRGAARRPWPAAA
jgi:HEPN domain-containing protein